MDSKESATKAIIATHGTQINGYTCKCSWGKETESSSSQNRSNTQQNSAYPQAPASHTSTQLITQFAIRNILQAISKLNLTNSMYQILFKMTALCLCY